MSVRKVNGYLTTNGQYFDTRAEADRYDATYRLMTALEAWHRKGLLRDMPDAIKEFLIENIDIVKAYLATGPIMEAPLPESSVSIPDPPPEDDEVIELNLDLPIGDEDAPDQRSTGEDEPGSEERNIPD